MCLPRSTGCRPLSHRGVNTVAVASVRRGRRVVRDVTRRVKILQYSWERQKKKNKNIIYLRTKNKIEYLTNERTKKIRPVSSRRRRRRRVLLHRANDCCGMTARLSVVRVLVYVQHNNIYYYTRRDRRQCDRKRNTCTRMHIILYGAVYRVHCVYSVSRKRYDFESSSAVFTSYYRSPLVHG